MVGELEDLAEPFRQTYGIHNGMAKRDGNSRPGGVQVFCRFIGAVVLCRVAEEDVLGVRRTVCGACGSSSAMDGFVASPEIFASEPAAVAGLRRVAK